MLNKGIQIGFLEDSNLIIKPDKNASNVYRVAQNQKEVLNTVNIAITEIIAAIIGPI